MTGKDLFKNLVNATGLPEDLISSELQGVLKNSNLSVEDLSLDDLRRVLAEYLQDEILQAKNNFSQKS